MNVKNGKNGKNGPTAEMLDWAERGEQCTILMRMRRFITGAEARVIRGRMRRSLGLAGMLAAVVCLSGCMSALVPKTTISGSIGGQPFAISTPKNTKLANLHVTAGTNGTASIDIGSLETVMDPAVITTTADGEAKLVAAGAAAAVQMMNAAPK